jgi:O-antigen ligase
MKNIYKNLIYGGVLILPLYFVRFKIFGLPTNIWEAWVIITFLAIIGTPRYWHKASGYIKKEREIMIFLGLIFSGFFLSTIINKNYLIGLGIIKGWLVIPVLFSILSWMVIDEKDRLEIFFSYYFSAVAVALLALGYYFFGYLTFDGRLQAFFNSPNYLAMYLASGMVIGAIYATEADLPLRKSNFHFGEMLFYLYSGLILVAIYLTYSYASWAAMLISLLFVFWMKHKDKKTTNKPFITRKTLFLALVAVLIVGFLQSKSTKLNDLASINSRSSLASRLIIWKSAGRMLEGNWLWGIGPGNFQKAYLDNQKYYPPYLEWAVPHPHNIFLAFWLYSGIIGLLGFFGLLYLFFKKILSTQNKNPARYLALGIMLYILLHGLFDTTYFKNDLSVIFWLCFLGL